MRGTAGLGDAASVSLDSGFEIPVGRTRRRWDTSPTLSSSKLPMETHTRERNSPLPSRRDPASHRKNRRVQPL